MRESIEGEGPTDAPVHAALGDLGAPRVPGSASAVASKAAAARDSGDALGWRDWATLSAAAAAIRGAVVFALLGGMPLVSDARDYFALATRLAEGRPVGAFYWPPGESIALAPALAVAGPSLAAARLVTIALSVATVVFVALLGRELDGARTGRVAGWMAAIYPPSVLLCGQTYAQHLAALCLAALAYFGLRGLREARPGLCALAGLAMGLGCLTRPSMVSVAPVMAVAWVIILRERRGALGRPATALGRRTRWRLVAGGAAATAVALACVLPVQAHDARAGAGWTLSTNNERNLFLGNNPYTPDYKTSHLGQRSLDELDPNTRAYLESFYERPDARAAMQHAAIAYMVAHPARTAWRTINRATSFWGFDYLASREIQRWRGWPITTASLLLFVEGAAFIVIVVLAVVALFALRRAGDRGWRAWVVALALAYEAPYVIAFSGGTYHFPVAPLLIALGALTVTHAREGWPRLRKSRSAQVVLCVLAVVELQYAYYAVAMSG